MAYPKDLNKEEELDKFQFWLMEMWDTLDHFINELPEELELDFSPASFLRIEKWILNNYRTIDEIKKDKTKLDALARYVGETFRKELEGIWELSLDDPKYIYYGIPQINFKAKNVTPICPLTMVTACVDRRKGDYIYSIFTNKKKRIKG
ncbi:hypothetical protein [Desmospora profundinema]|uniref:Transposase n=1 Tax=Desmospora profundinema TaxID=1571184 RepID=A0ABU1IQ04_9BACL|nr:hypothetical protein [Desmospora profundinema]MDR6226823.1 hypothetical protein [Desmospora profundinema]